MLFISSKVSWIRKRDYQLLTVGLKTHSRDDRFTINYVHWVRNEIVTDHKLMLLFTNVCIIFIFEVAVTGNMYYFLVYKIVILFSNEYIETSI